jgi:hypothetical protein
MKLEVEPNIILTMWGGGLSTVDLEVTVAVVVVDGTVGEEVHELLEVDDNTTGLNLEAREAIRDAERTAVEGKTRRATALLEMVPSVSLV